MLHRKNQYFGKREQYFLETYHWCKLLHISYKIYLQLQIIFQLNFCGTVAAAVLIKPNFHWGFSCRIKVRSIDSLIFYQTVFNPILWSCCQAANAKIHIWSKILLRLDARNLWLWHVSRSCRVTVLWFVSRACVFVCVRAAAGPCA